MMFQTFKGKFRINQPANLVILLLYLGGFLLIFIPLEVMEKIGNQIHPLGQIQEKTVLLFRFIKTSTPIIGIIGFFWMNFSIQTKNHIWKAITKLLDHRWTLPLILIITFSLRLWWVMFFPNRLYADAEWYYQRAIEISKGHGYIYDGIPGKPTAAWPIGYPAFLAFIFFFTTADPFVGKVANAFISIGIVFFTYSLNKKTTSHRTGIVSGFLLAIMPGHIAYSSLLNSDLFFMTLFLLILRLTMIETDDHMDKRFSLLAILTGLGLGFATITRTVGILLFPLLVYIKHQSEPFEIKQLFHWSVNLALGTFIVVLPWTIRNYIHFNKLILVSNNGGVNFWMGNNPNAYGGFYFPRDDSNPLLPLIGDEIAVNERSYQLGWEFIQENPGGVIKLMPAKIFYLFNSNDAALTWNRSSRKVEGQPGTGIIAFAVTNFYHFFMAVLAIVGLVKMVFEPPHSRKLIWLGVLTSFYWTIVHLPFFGLDRFVLPLTPFLVFYASIGMKKIFEANIQSLSLKRA